MQIYLTSPRLIPPAKQGFPSTLQDMRDERRHSDSHEAWMVLLDALDDLQLSEPWKTTATQTVKTNNIGTVN